MQDGFGRLPAASVARFRTVESGLPIMFDKVRRTLFPDSLQADGLKWKPMSPKKTLDLGNALYTSYERPSIWLKLHSLAKPRALKWGALTPYRPYKTQRPRLQDPLNEGKGPIPRDHGYGV